MLILLSLLVSLARSAPEYRGLPGVDVDSWTSSFFRKSEAADASAPKGADVLKKLKAAVGADGNLEAVFKRIRSTRIARPGLSAADFNTLIQALYAARLSARDGIAKDSARARGLMLLLGALADEAIHAENVIHGIPAEGAEIKTVYQAIDGKTCKDAKGKARVAKLNGVQVCQGDVLVSKGAAGSSSFLARFADEPGSFSHSTVAWVDSKAASLVFPEAFIEDGLKLRTPDADYVTDRKRKLAVYRLREPKKRAKELASAIQSVDSIRAEMAGRVDDPFTEASYPYDFSFLATGAGAKDAYFCSEVAYQVYAGATGLAPELNPYAEPVWSTITGGTSDFLREFLKIETDRFPAPSDVELNAEWDLVAFTVNRAKIAEDRVDVAMIDTLLDLLNSGSVASKKLIAAGAKLPDQDLTKAQILDLVKLADLSDEQEAAISKQIPDRATLKQLVFFGALNGVITPKIREAMADAEAKSIEKTGAPLGVLKMRDLLRGQLEKELAKLAEGLEGV